MARRYARDNRGRFASGGGGATARGGRLRTAAGNKRKTQTMQASAAPKGTIGKPRGLKPQSAKPAPSAATIAQVGRERRATRNLNAAMKREAEGPGSKASRSASVAKRARAIYAGKADPKQKTAARLTRTNNPEALRKRIKKIKDNNAAKPARAATKPAAKSAPKAATSLQAVNARRARASAPRTSTYLSQKLNTQSAITRSAANAIYNRQRAVGKAGGLDKSVIRSPIGIMPKTSGSVRNRAEQVREAARKRVVGGRRR